MKAWRDIRDRARETRALVCAAAQAATATSVVDALVAHWDLVVTSAPASSALLRGARASWRESDELLAVDRSLSLEERAFALAHELAHKVCHPGPHSCAPADVESSTTPVTLPMGEGNVWGYNPRQAREIEASMFAAELVAPAAQVRQRFLAGETAAALATAYGVTRTCMLNQLVAAVLGGTGEEVVEPHRPAVVPPLDESQARAAQSTARRVIVDAGPGTGKTRTLVARVRYLLEHMHAAPHTVLALTFSNNAAQELRERLRNEAPSAAGVVVSTFHGFALDVLRRFAPQAGLPKDFRVVDDFDTAVLLEEALDTLAMVQYAHYARPGLYLPSLLETVSRLRDELLTVEDLAVATDAACAHAASGAEGEKLRETLTLVRATDELLERHGLVDYGGLISRLVQLLRDDAAVREAVCSEIRHILVDEYQDVNRASAVLVAELLGDETDLWVVGDARQAIFGFRGAAKENIAQFERDFPGAVRLTLDVNYRSTASMVGVLVAAAQITNGTPAHWTPSRPQDEGGGAVLALAEDEDAELAGLVTDIGQSLSSGLAPEEHAVLCRTHDLAAKVTSALEEAGLASSYLGDFFTRPEVLDMLAVLDLAVGPAGLGLVRMARWPAYAMDPVRVEQLLRVARTQQVLFPAALRDPACIAHLSPDERARLSQLATHLDAIRFYPDPAAMLQAYLFGDAPYLRDLLRDTSPGSRQAASALFQLLILARAFMTRPATTDADDPKRGFLAYVDRLRADTRKRQGLGQALVVVPGAVTVLTAHSSKGLEFHTVYIPRLRHGAFPYTSAGGVSVKVPVAFSRTSEERLADELNLLFVAMSRARARLVLSRPLRYGVKSWKATEPVALAALRQAYPLATAAWPGRARPLQAPPPPRPVQAPVLSGGDIVAVDRCPAQYDFRRRYGAYARSTPYREFSRILARGIDWLRQAWATEDWPQDWPQAAAALADLLGVDHLSRPSERWYHRRAWEAFERTYGEIAKDGIPATSHFDREHIVELAGSPVRVRIDVEEQVDPTMRRLVWDRSKKLGDDDESLTVALYAAVAQRDAGPVACTVAIRSLATGEIAAIDDPAAVLRKQVGRIALAARRLQTGDFLPAPADEDACGRCAFALVCHR